MPDYLQTAIAPPLETCDEGRLMIEMTVGLLLLLTAIYFISKK